MKTLNTQEAKEDYIATMRSITQPQTLNREEDLVRWFEADLTHSRTKDLMSPTTTQLI